MTQELCKTCIKWMDICHKKDSLAKLNIEHAGGRAVILSCDQYEKRNVEEVCHE